jgi:hypothetical protein
MASEKKEYLSGDENSRGRGDMGDEGGAKVGRPTPAPREAEGAASKGPSSRTTPEGLEGAIHETDAGDRGAQREEKSFGSGSEAARSTHGKQGRDTSTGSGAGEQEGGSSRGDSERLGSEPLARDREHKGSYGGEGGAPRTSSDTREPRKPE